MEIQGEREKIRTYSKQQLETKDNEVYRTLGRQIEACQKNISDLETEELMAMEEIDVQAETLKQAEAELTEADRDKATALAQIDEREANLKKTIEEMEGLRTEAAEKIDETTLSRYDRLLEKKGAKMQDIPVEDLQAINLLNNTTWGWSVRADSDRGDVEVARFTIQAVDPFS